MAPRLTHLALTCPDLERVVEFYGRHLGMRRVKLRSGPGGTDRVVWLAPAREDAPLLVFIERRAAPNPALRDSMTRHLGFALPDREAVDEVYRGLEAEGHDPTPPACVDETVGYITMVRDPAGHWVELSAGQDVSPANWDA